MDEYICPACNRTHGPTSGYCDAVDPFRDHATQRELETRREIMAWVADKLAKLETDMGGLPVNVAAVKYWTATVIELRHALTDNPLIQAAEKRG